MDKPSKIVIQNVWMEFPNHRRSARAPARRNNDGFAVLEKIDLEVREGEFVCIVGPSGCGKSTLLNIVGGFLKATGGRVLIDGVAVDRPDPRRIFIFQENSVFPWLNVEENIGFGLLSKGPQERKRIVTHYVEMVGLAGFGKSYPHELSGGMKQRVEICRALAANPDVLYMDEPFGALDFLTRMRMRAELIEIWQREKKTILFVTHDVEESVQLADRVVVMSHRPAAIATIIDVKIPRPRDLDSVEYLTIRDEIFEVMGLDHSGISSGQGGSDELVASGAPRVMASPLKAKKLDAEVIIIGGGPAGSALGIHLANSGVDHLIIDKAHHPRAHVGESLSYSTTKLLEELDFLQVMERERFLVKRGVSWISWHDRQQIDIEFCGLGQFDHAYQVDRANFDDLLLRHARGKGSRVFSGAQVDRVDFNRRGFAGGVTVKVGGSRFALKSNLVVDASGRQTLLGRQLRLLRPASDLPQFAVHSWFANVARGKSETATFTHIYLLPIRRGWVWQIPINDEVTSVGVVSDREHHVKSGEDVDQFFKWTVSLNPVLAERMNKAERLRELRMDGNYSYHMERFAGDGWLVAGDAAFFVDPIFSSGISDALHAAKFAADAIICPSTSGNYCEKCFDSYERKLRQGVSIWQDFVRLFYDVAPIFGRVIAEGEFRNPILRICEGEVYDESAGQALAQMKNAVEAIRADPDHACNKLLSESLAWLA